MIKEKHLAIWGSALLIAVIIAPIKENWKAEPKDSFPFSYYPMFSKKRGETYGMYYLLGVDTLGQRHFLSYKLAGTGGFNQVRRQITKRAKKGEGRELLDRVEQQLKRKKKSFSRALSEIYLVKGVYHLERFLLQEEMLPMEETILASKKL